METDSASAGNGNFHAIRKMWSVRAGANEQPRQQLARQQKRNTLSSNIDIPVLKITNTSTGDKSADSTVYPLAVVISPIEDDSCLPLSLSSTFFRHQARVVNALEQSVNNMTVDEKRQAFAQVPTITGRHRWDITRHVFRSGLIFNRTRRASDSILPLLIKTHQAASCSRANSLDETPFQSFVDYLCYPKEEKPSKARTPRKLRRSGSEMNDCLRRNRLDDAILQYKIILRHLKNYEQFTMQHPARSSAAVTQRERSFDNEFATMTSTEKEDSSGESAASKRVTQSLSRNFGRTFANFIMNDLYLSSSSKSTSEQKPCRSLSHTSSQTDPVEETQDQPREPTECIDSAEPANHVDVVSAEDANDILHQFDAMLDQQHPSPPTTDASNEVQPELPPSVAEVGSVAEKPLMQVLFEGKKTAFKLSDLEMKSVRLPDGMLPVYETIKRNCTFDTEKSLYITRIRKVRRRTYTQHERLFMITTERIYNITKAGPYPNEALVFREITGVTCTPYKDGFVCIHAKDSNDDRGDWLLVTERPCELVTQLFMALGRSDNNDHFLKMAPKFSHCRRFTGESSYVDCSVEVYLAPHFNIKKIGSHSMMILTP